MKKILIQKNEKMNQQQIMQADRVLPVIQSIVNAAKDIGITITNDNLKNFFTRRDAERFMREHFESHVPESATVAGIKVRREKLIEMLELPDLTGVLNEVGEAETLRKQFVVNYGIFTVTKGKATIDKEQQARDLDSVHTYLVLANKQEEELWNILTAYSDATNKLNDFFLKELGFSHEGKIKPHDIKNSRLLKYVEGASELQPSVSYFNEIKTRL